MLMRLEGVPLPSCLHSVDESCPVDGDCYLYINKWKIPAVVGLVSFLFMPIWLSHPNQDFHILALDSQAEQAAKVEKMRQSILEGLNFSRQSHPLPFPPPAALPFYPGSMYPRHFGPIPPAQGRGRGFAGEARPLGRQVWGLLCLPHLGLVLRSGDCVTVVSLGVTFAVTASPIRKGQSVEWRSELQRSCGEEL